MPRTKADAMAGYVPLTWDADSELGPEERETIENERRQLWRKGIRGALLESLAYEFAALICMKRAAQKVGIR